MHGKPCFYGSATVGTKGQIVIPLEAREALNIGTGDKVIVIGVHEGKKQMLGICPVKSVEALLGALNEHLQSMQHAVEQAKNEEA